MESTMNGNPWLTAFVDETGTNELDSTKPGVSHLFICVAVVVNESGFAETDAAIRRLSQELCSGAEIASKRIKSDHGRRIKFLEGIKGLPFGYYALVINKERIFKDSGLKQKPSFYKYINNMLYQRLAKTSSNLRVVADQIGGQDFMGSFEKYLNKQGLPNLFFDFKHTFANSSETPLIQLADLIAGTLSYCFDEEKKSSYSPVFRDLLRSREIGIHCWPLEPAKIPDFIPTTDQEYDEWLEASAKNRAVRFIQEHESSSDEDQLMQAAVVRSLLFSRQFEDRAKQAIYSDQLIEILKNQGFEELSKQAFSSRVIGKIREAEIILSGSNDGYRLALSAEDIKDYLDHDKSILIPMIRRLSIARTIVKQDTANRYDILAGNDYAMLKKLVEEFRDLAIATAVRIPEIDELDELDGKL